MTSTWCGRPDYIDNTRLRPATRSTVAIPFTGMVHYCIMSLPNFRTHGALKDSLDSVLWLLATLGKERPDRTKGGKVKLPAIEIPDKVMKDEKGKSILSALDLFKLPFDVKIAIEDQHYATNVLQDNLEQAHAEGVEEGKAELEKDLVKRLSNLGKTVEQIAMELTLSEDEILRIQND